MMASHQTHGIQQLLVAEKRAAEKVAEARKRKCSNLEFGKHFDHKLLMSIFAANSFINKYMSRVFWSRPEDALNWSVFRLIVF